MQVKGRNRGSPGFKTTTVLLDEGAEQMAGATKKGKAYDSESRGECQSQYHLDGLRRACRARGHIPTPMYEDGNIPKNFNA